MMFKGRVLHTLHKESLDWTEWHGRREIRAPFVPSHDNQSTKSWMYFSSTDYLNRGHVLRVEIQLSTKGFVTSGPVQVVLRPEEISGTSLGIMATDVVYLQGGIQIVGVNFEKSGTSPFRLSPFINALTNSKDSSLPGVTELFKQLSTQYLFVGSPILSRSSVTPGWFFTVGNNWISGMDNKLHPQSKLYHVSSAPPTLQDNYPRISSIELAPNEFAHTRPYAFDHKGQTFLFFSVRRTDGTYSQDAAVLQNREYVRLGRASMSFSLTTSKCFSETDFCYASHVGEGFPNTFIASTNYQGQGQTLLLKLDQLNMSVLS